MKKIFLLLVLFVSVNLFAEEVKFYKTSYDCTKTQEKSVAYRVCKNQDLAKEDLELSKVWKSFQVITKEFKKEQLEWLKQKNSCQTKECIQEKYKTRIATLKQRLSNQNTYPETLLDLMKKTEEAVKIEFSGSKEKKVFFKDLYTFENMSVSKPVLYKVDYNNTKLQKLLGQNCWNMRLDFKISLIENYTDYKGYAAHQMEKFSLWNVDMDGDGHKELILAKYGTNTYQYDLIEKNYCKKFKATPYTDVCLQNMRKNSSNVWYDFFNTQNQLIHPYCTLEQKIVGFFSHNSNIEKGIKEKVLIINWKGKSCLLHIIYSSDKISLVLYGNKKLEFFCQQNYNSLPYSSVGAYSCRHSQYKSRLIQ